MRQVTITAPDWALDFAGAKQVADGVATSLLGEATCLSWYDRERDYESPAGATECHDPISPHAPARDDSAHCWLR